MACTVNLISFLNTTSANNGGSFNYLGFNATSDIGPFVFNTLPTGALQNTGTPNATINTTNFPNGYYQFQYSYGSVPCLQTFNFVVPVIDYTPTLTASSATHCNSENINIQLNSLITGVIPNMPWFWSATYQPSTSSPITSYNYPTTNWTNGIGINSTFNPLNAPIGYYRFRININFGGVSTVNNSYFSHPSCSCPSYQSPEVLITVLGNSLGITIPTNLNRCSP